MLHKTLFKFESTTKNLDLRISYEAAMIIIAMGEDNITKACRYFTNFSEFSKKKKTQVSKCFKSQVT